MRVTGVWSSGRPLRLGAKVDVRRLERALVGVRIGGLRRRGKYLVIDFDGTRRDAVLVHLGMSGRLKLVRAREPRPLHTHFVLQLSGPRRGGSFELRFTDPRRFGLVSLLRGGRLEDHPGLRGLGPDPLEEELSGELLHERLQGTRRSLKTALLDQRVVAGIGNIYASEALWKARLRPTLPGTRLSRPRAAALARAITEVLRHALDHGGTSLRDFVDAEGVQGEHADYLWVYGREGERCPRRGCRGVIRRRVQQGRATFHCPRCQK
jgi:formamidopyrimidine-DNA glycosylase